MSSYSARVKLSPALAKLLRSQLENAIYEAALSKDDDLIARRYLVEKQAQADIAAELCWERSTISRRLPAIVASVEQAAAILYT